ncbi:MAG TPA: OsmC family protein [Polyangiaceae bacterium]|nr:OsmC family protein [Polyangiaceae bacterium]
MNVEELRAAQAPLKARYKTDPGAALVKLQAHGSAEAPAQICRVETNLGVVEAGLHPATGGDGRKACSGDMLLQALVACAGVTLGAVATAMGVTLRSARIRAEGEVDFRGTLGVARDAPVGFRNIRLHFELDSDAEPGTVAKLLELTERYCVVYQTLKHAPALARD